MNKIQRIQPSATALSKPAPNDSQSLSVEGPLSRVKLGSSIQKPASSSTPSATFKNGRPTPPLATDALKAPPKKGSFAEIMARGKAAQSTLGQVGKIQHKKIEKLPSKREREEMKIQRSSNLAKNLAPSSKFGKAPLSNGRDVRNGLKEGGKKAPPEPEKKIKKAATATTGYAGTARPKPGGAKVPARSSVSSSSRYDRGPDRNRYRDERHGSSARYAYVSEEEEEEEEEEREYDSDVSSDMEAAAFEVDEEEEMAARIARREDAEALAEENKLKKEKEEKRKRLAAMARSRR